MELTEAKQKFIQAWGSFGGEWGINKTMAQIHGMLLISTEALCTDEVMEALQISRGNANMNIRTLVDWGIVYKESIPGDRRDFYTAEKDIWLVSRKIAGQRRKRELEPMLRVLSQVSGAKGKDKAETEAFNETVSELKEMASFADGLLNKFEESEKRWMFKALMKIIN